MYDEDWQRAARAVRAEVIGDDGTRTTPSGDPVPPEYQDYLTAMAWGGVGAGRSAEHP